MDRSASLEAPFKNAFIRRITEPPASIIPLVWEMNAHHYYLYTFSILNIYGSFRTIDECDAKEAKN